MALTINNFEILNGGTQIAIDVETELGYIITNIDLWKMDDYSDPSLAINLNSYLQQVNNKEVLLLNAADLNLSVFEDILFVQIMSNVPAEELCSTCSNPALGVTYNLGPYYNCLLNYLFELQLTQCTNCNKNESDQMVIMLNMLIDNTIKCIEVGYYVQAVSMINKLKKLCSIKKCNNCPSIDFPSANNFIQA